MKYLDNSTYLELKNELKEIHDLKNKIEKLENQSLYNYRLN